MMIHKKAATWHGYFPKVAIYRNFDEKNLFWEVNRWKKDALVVDSSDHGTRRSLGKQKKSLCAVTRPTLGKPANF